MTELSVILVNYNGKRLLNDCLNSIFQQTKGIKFEVILVDNNSSDGSLELIKQGFPDTQIISNAHNLGFAAANNQGIKKSQGKFILLLNTDTIVQDGALQNMVQFLKTNPKAGLCGPLLLNTDGTPQHQGGLFNKKFWLAKTPVKVGYMIGAALMVRREVIEQVGLLDENFFFSNEDLDWCRRIKKAGWEIYFVPQAKITHLGGFTISKFNQRLFVEGFRGGLYFCRKHYGPLTYQTYRLLLAIIALPAIFLSTFFSPKHLPAYWQILKITLTGDIFRPKISKNILLVSNGHAEDLAAAWIGEALLKIKPEIEIEALPLVGLGKAYDKKEIRNLGLKKVLPSGGFAKEGLAHFLKDISAGLFGSLAGQIKILRRVGRSADLIVGMGDIYLVALTGFITKKKLIYIDGPNSIRIRPYYPLEKWLMRKYCQTIIVQDQVTADALVKDKLPGLFLGSWVMDYVPVTGETFGLKDKTVIGILPGTREEAYDNFILILDLLEAMAKSGDFVGLAALALDKAKLQHKLQVTSYQYQGDRIRLPSGKEVLLSEGKFGDVCKASKLIIGLAGIANEQAVGFGVPTVAFKGHGPQTTPRRWAEIHNITGDSMAVISGLAEELAQQIWQILNDPVRLQKMRQIGLESKKDQGGIVRIAQLIANEL